MSKVAVQLLTYNGQAYLPSLFDSLKAQSFRDFELFVLDNASSDNSGTVASALCASFPLPAHFEKTDANTGFAGGHTILFDRHSAEYVLCVNQDVVLAPDYIEKLVAFLDAHPQVASCAGKTVHGEGNREIDSAGLSFRWFGAVVDRGAGEIDHGQYDGTTEVFGVSGAVPLYRRSAVKAVSDEGMFDADFFAYKEDVDLAWRLRLAGFSSYVVGSARAYHSRSVAAQSLSMPGVRLAKHSSWRQVLSTRNHLFTVVKNFAWGQSRFIPAILAYETAKFFFLLVRQPSALAAYPSFFRLLPKFIKKRKVVQSAKKQSIDEWIT